MWDKSVSLRQSGARSAAGFAILCILGTMCRSQQYTSYERGEVETMLLNITADIKKHYYDPQMHGVDWDAKVRDAKEKID